MYPPHRDFEERHVYLQWLYRRGAQPIRINRILLKYLWGALIIFLILNSNSPGYSSVNSLLLYITGILLSVVPIVLTFLIFLYYCPLAIQDDTKSSTMDFIFASPVPTGTIVSDLRRFIGVQNLRFLAPSVTWVLAVIFTQMYQFGSPNLNYWYDWAPIILVPLLLVLFWWMLLETGVAAAALPRFVTVTGLLFLLWLVPLLVLIFWGGYYAAEWDYSLWFAKSGPASYTTYRQHSSYYYEYFSIWLMAHYGVFMFVGGLIPWLLSKRLMDFRRGGAWR